MLTMDNTRFLTFMVKFPSDSRTVIFLSMCRLKINKHVKSALYHLLRVLGKAAIFYRFAPPSRPGDASATRSSCGDDGDILRCSMLPYRLVDQCRACSRNARFRYVNAAGRARRSECGARVVDER